MNWLLLAASLLVYDTTDSMIIPPWPWPFMEVKEGSVIDDSVIYECKLPFYFDVSSLQFTLVHEADTVFSGSVWGYLDFLQALEDAGYDVEVVEGGIIYNRKEE